MIVFPLPLFLGTFLVLCLAAWLGASRFEQLRAQAFSLRQVFGVIQGATLTLLGLIIGFTFSMALDRYEQRKDYEGAEASAIITAYLRAELLPPADTARVRTLLEQVGLIGWAHRPVRTLSRGLEQRCGLGRALLHEPDLLLMDEPFTGLDVDAAHTLREMLQQAHARGTTLIMTTHDLAQGFALCRRAIVLVRGRLVWNGPIQEEERSGNLTVVCHLLATPWAPPFADSILLLEETGEEAYRVDRLLVHLAASGGLGRVRGVLLGMLDVPRTRRVFPPDRRLDDLLVERFASLGIPVVRGLPVGHGPGKRTVPIGGTAAIDTARGTVELGTRLPR